MAGGGGCWDSRRGSSASEVGTDDGTAKKYIYKKYDCRSDLAPKHARKHETHPPRVKKKRKKRGLLLSYQNPNLSEGADSVGGQLRGDKDQCPFSGVTKSGRVWRKVPESGARSVAMDLSRHVDVSVHTGSQPTPHSEHRFPAPSSKLCQI